MAILIGSARIDENGKITGGNAGDQTGREVMTETFYMDKRGWYCLRPKKPEVAEKIAEAMQQACDNVKIGYDQNNRLSVVTNIKKYGTLKAISVPTEADCGTLIRACIYQATGVDVGEFYTGNEAAVLEKSGIFEKAFVVTSSADVRDGDILVTKVKGHTVAVVSGRSRVQTEIIFTYCVRAGGIWYPEVQNLSDYAGVRGKAITDVAIKVNVGVVKYRVHVAGGGWLPWVTGYDLKDYNNGYAGNGKAIDAIEVVLSDGKKAKYRVSPVKKGYYDWQYDNETSDGQDGYAGLFGKKIDRFQLCCK